MALSVPVNGLEDGDKEPLIELFVKVGGGARSDLNPPRFYLSGPSASAGRAWILPRLEFGGEAFSSAAGGAMPRAPPPSPPASRPSLGWSKGPQSGRPTHRGGSSAPGSPYAVGGDVFNGYLV